MLSSYRCWIAVLLSLPALALAQPAAPQSLKDIAQQAILSNPEVLQRWHAYLAADGERDAAFGNYLPRLDFTAGYGKERQDAPKLSYEYTVNSRSLTLTQMLYDGFATRNEVKRLDHSRRVRMFELYDASENAALEAARAYLDVLRYRRLVTLAEDNYVRHRAVFDQIQQKVQVGVGRRVDLEQAAGRLALAESNLLTETANLHDVSARFQRIIGFGPAKTMEEPTPLSKNLPPDIAGALRQAQQGNPTLQAAIENVRAADAARDVRKAAYQPRLDLRVRRDDGDNMRSIAGRSNYDTAEVVLSWNLLNGLSDVARSRQYAEQYNVARDIRDKTCRDTRQVLTIAFNDVRKLTEQLNYLDQHQLSTEKVHEAYRKQFDIGQRTLLDLLDTENELFQAKRAYTNGSFDLSIAYARTHAGLGNLLTALGLSRAGEQTLAELANWTPAQDAAEYCPPEGMQIYVADKAALDARAQEMLKESAAATVAAMAAARPQQKSPPAAVIATPSAPKADMQAKPVAVPAPAPAEPAAVPSAPPATTVEAVLDNALKQWLAAWSTRDVEAYLNAYAPNFTPAGDISREAWSQKRRQVLGRTEKIAIEVKDVQFNVQGEHAEARFRQSYRAPSFSDVVLKTLSWQQIDGKWLIVAETAEPVRP
ncbi:adhesin transport system outer membrane protein [Sulfurisoma sediminicola]|uniref:Adhesin transport system outer membrane protein n=2 Tax=Sulfurisoma sediminicola TaxID=1381557 RepID=A0A497XK03_9PROT|nr:adhesin transport system outer membrane protein [Sulfurisoma sediminicola]